MPASSFWCGAHDVALTVLPVGYFALKFNVNFIAIHFEFPDESDLPVEYDIKLSRHMGKPTICVCENKGADQLRGNREADQRLYFRYTDSTIPLLSKSKISSL